MKQIEKIRQTSNKMDRLNEETSKKTMNQNGEEQGHEADREDQVNQQHNGQTTRRNKPENYETEWRGTGT